MRMTYLSISKRYRTIRESVVVIFIYYIYSLYLYIIFIYYIILYYIVNGQDGDRTAQVKIPRLKLGALVAACLFQKVINYRPTLR